MKKKKKKVPGDARCLQDLQRMAALLVSCHSVKAKKFQIQLPSHYIINLNDQFERKFYFISRGLLMSQLRQRQINIFFVFF